MCSAEDNSLSVIRVIKDSFKNYWTNCLTSLAKIEKLFCRKINKFTNINKFFYSFMKISKKYFSVIFLFLAAFSISQNAMACACGCGVLNVGTSSLIPNCEGGIAFMQYDYMSQTRNWSGGNKSSGHNHDKRIETQTITAGAQYMFNRDWGAAIRVPYVTRFVSNSPHHGGPIYTRHSDIGDVRVNGIYSGLFDDMSTGITFGLKLPTGQTNANTIERNQQIGTGSTDSILGAYHMGNFGKSKAGYFAQTSWERPFIRHQGFTPGSEISGATGVYYNLGQFGEIKRVAPILQFTAAKKTQDSGWADPHHNPNTGYSMMFFNPGIEMTIDKFKIYADVGFPIYRRVNGNQLVPQNIYKVILGYNF